MISTLGYGFDNSAILLLGKDMPITVSFTDISADTGTTTMWYGLFNTAGSADMTTAASRPYNIITRAEVTTIVNRMMDAMRI